MTATPGRLVNPRGTTRQGLARTSRRDPWWVDARRHRGRLRGVHRLLALLGAGLVSAVRGRVRGGRLSLAVLLATHLRERAADLDLAGIFILWIPLGFRTTCYYYRKAYYRSYFADPPACAVGEPTIHRGYAMERAFPFILQNIHRWFLYLAFVPLFFLWYDAFASFVNTGQVRIGLGSFLLLANAALLSGYSLSCHSLRHLAGGRLDCFSCGVANRVRYRAWQRLTGLNERHMLWAWVSLVSVAMADLYVRAIAAGWIVDPAIFL